MAIPSKASINFIHITYLCPLLFTVQSLTHLRRNKALQLVRDWCKRWQILINYEKPVPISTTCKKNMADFTCVLNGMTIKCVREYRYFGLMLNSCWNFNKHIWLNKWSGIHCFGAVLRYSRDCVLRTRSHSLMSLQMFSFATTQGAQCSYLFLLLYVSWHFQALMIIRFPHRHTGGVHQRSFAWGSLQNISGYFELTAFL